MGSGLANPLSRMGLPSARETSFEALFEESSG
jgi:hypothetical protein